jgi:histidine ammonia-lyase
VGGPRLCHGPQRHEQQRHTAQRGRAARPARPLAQLGCFDGDPKRIIQDPESLRASSIRQAAAWEEWAALRDAVLFQANSSDHNPAVRVGLGPRDSWELATPQMMKYFVKGGPYSHGQHGYVVSNANWDPYPMANKLGNFVIALGNMDVAITLRIERFRNPFFTVVAASEVLPHWQRRDSGYLPSDLQQEIQGLTNPAAPFGNALESTVEDLQAQTRLKVQRARQAVSVTMDLLAFDILEASLWLDVRRTQDPGRSFGSAVTAAWVALRKQVPLENESTSRRLSRARRLRQRSSGRRRPQLSTVARARPESGSGRRLREVGREKGCAVAVLPPQNREEALVHGQVADAAVATVDVTHFRRMEPRVR